MTPCIEWTGCLNAYGYGVRTIKRKVYLVHRLAWEDEHGPIPDGLCVLHHCDNRACRNVEHLFLGTRGDNNRDCAAKGRHVGYRKLTAEQIEEIRMSTERNMDLAQRFSVVPSTITRIRPSRRARSSRRSDSSERSAAALDFV